MPANPVTNARLAARIFVVAALCSAPVNPVIAELPNRAPHHKADHATACGILQLAKEFRRAVEHCDAALRDNSVDSEALSNRGSAHLMLGALDEALADFNAAILLRPQDASHFFNRALVHTANKAHEQAIADYAEAIRLMPGLAIAYNNRGYLFELTGERDKAIADYRMALSLAPSLHVIKRNLQRLGAEP